MAKNLAEVSHQMHENKLQQIRDKAYKKNGKRRNVVVPEHKQDVNYNY